MAKRKNPAYSWVYNTNFIKNMTNYVKNYLYRTTMYHNFSLVIELFSYRYNRSLI
jgi:predicted metal-dependent HD superfamily phosphohydrolase